MIEQYYGTQQLCELLGLSRKTIRERIVRGDFGRGVVFFGGGMGRNVVAGHPTARGDYRVPASGVRSYLEAHKVFAGEAKAEGDAVPVELRPMPARSVGDLRRKVDAVFSA